eukprot:1151686-Pelagomonas_calceolata.AAC.19
MLVEAHATPARLNLGWPAAQQTARAGALSPERKVGAAAREKHKSFATGGAHGCFVCLHRMRAWEEAGMHKWQHAGAGICQMPMHVKHDILSSAKRKHARSVPQTYAEWRLSQELLSASRAMLNFVDCALPLLHRGKHTSLKPSNVTSLPTCPWFRFCKVKSKT